MAYSYPLILAAAVLGAACQSNSIELESMTDSAADSDATSAGTDASTTSPTTGPGTVTVSTTDVDTSDPTDARLDLPVDVGEPLVMLLAIDTTINPGLPFQGIVWLQRVPSAAVDLRLQWLSLDVGSTTEPRELVGDVYTYEGIPFEDDGSFTWDTGVILVPGEANPITGSDVVLSASAHVAPDGSPFCGRVSGEVTSPIQVSLDGSTHAMTEVPDVSTLPLDVVSSCP